TRQRVTFARDGFDQSRFSAAVGTEDGGMLAGADGEAEIAQGDVAAAHDGDMAKIDERGRRHRNLYVSVWTVTHKRIALVALAAALAMAGGTVAFRAWT